MHSKTSLVGIHLVRIYCIIPNKSSGLIEVCKQFLVGLYLGVYIWGAYIRGAYIRGAYIRDYTISKN